MIEILQREAIYLWYYITILLRQIAPYWVIGILLGSVISVFGKNKINDLFMSMKDKKLGLLGIILSCLLGIASPLCMYGTIPIAASFASKGMREDWLAAFMMGSILLNPQLIIYSAALGATALILRFLSCFICGIVAGLLVHTFYQNKKFFRFDKYTDVKNRDTDPNMFIRLLKNIWRNMKASGIYFLVGILLTACFQRYVPTNAFADLLGSNKGFGVLMAATLGVPVYMCGGGTIPLLREWLHVGMSMGAAIAFMITGPATKLTNLGALKSVLGGLSFALYLAFVSLFAVVSGLLTDLLI
jgi:hypothetical protein